MAPPIVNEARHPVVPNTEDLRGYVNPRGGVVVREDSPDDDVLDLLEFVREVKVELDLVDGEISQWLRDRADVRQRWTFAGGRATVPSSRPITTWNLEALMTLLPQLVAARKITQRDADRCLRTTVSVVAEEVNRLKNEATPDVAEQIMACRSTQPKSSRKVSLK